MFTKRFNIQFVLLLGCVVVQIKAKASSESVHDPPVITPNFYDPNHHDDGRNHLRGPTAASSSSTFSIMNPYAAASSASSEVYNKPTPGNSGSIMAIVDHFYGPNGEEQVKYTNPNHMDKEELEHLIASLGNSGSTSKMPFNVPQHSPNNLHYPQYSPSPSKMPPPPPKYVGAPLSSLYKSGSSPSYSSSVPTAGYSLPSLYKSSGESSYSKPAATYRTPFSTIYKDPQYGPPPTKPYHFSKGSSEYSPPSYGSVKDSVLLRSPKEPSYFKGSPYFSSDSPPKSISDAILSNGYHKGYSPVKGLSNVIDHEDSYPYAQSPPSYYPPPPSPSHIPSHHQPHHELGGGGDYSGKLYSPSMGGHLKAGFHSLPVKYAGSHGPEYGHSSTPPGHDTYSAGFGGGYSAEESSDPYSRSIPKGYMKRPSSSLYSSSPSPPSHSGGHSLSSLYEPLAFDDLYNSPKAKTIYSSPGMQLPKPGYGSPSPPPSAYALSYGPPVEYHMPPKGIGYSTSASPYGGPGLPGGLSPKYKGPYRTVNSDPSGYASPGYGYGKPHSSHHEGEHKTPDSLDISVAKDEYEDERKYIRGPPPTPQQSSSPPSSLPPHLVQEYHQSLSPVTPTGPSQETLNAHDDYNQVNNEKPRHHPNHHHPPSHESYPHHPPSHGSYHPPSHEPHHPPSHGPHHPPSHGPHHPPSHDHHSHYRPYPVPQEISNEISHGPPRPSNNYGESSDEVQHVHIFEKGFFDKERNPRGKVRHNEKWKPVARNYSFGGSVSGEGGHGSASMERDARAVAVEEAKQQGSLNKQPPPSRRKPLPKSSKRPYHHKDEEEERRNSNERPDNNRERSLPARYTDRGRGRWMR